MKTKFKETEIGLIPEDWKVKEIQEVTTKIGDGLHGTPTYDNNGDYYFINGNNLSDGKIQVNDNTKKSTKEEFEKYKKELNSRTVMVSINGTLGNVALYRGEKIILGKSVCYINVKQEINIFFIKNVLNNNHFQNFIQLTATGTTIKNISLKQIREFKFGIPVNVIEQSAIAKIISDLDSKIELNQNMNKTLEEIGKVIFKHWFIDFEFPNEDDKPYKFSGGEMVYDDDLGKMIPKGWKVSKIGDEFKIILGGTPSTTNKSYWKNGTVPWINSGKINEFRITEPTTYITEEAVNNSATKLLPKGTTVLAITGATLGQISRIEIDTCANQSVIGIIGSEDIPSEYIYFWIIHTIGEIIQYQTGGAQQHINKNNVSNTKFLIPSIKTIQEYQKVIKTIFEKISLICFEINELTQIRDLLLPKLMSGKIRVPVEAN